MQGFALVLFFSAISLQFHGILSENQTICPETSESHRSKRNHENDSSQYRKQIQSKTINTKDALDKKPLTFLVKNETKKGTRKNNELKNTNRLVVDIHDGYGNNHQNYPGVKVLRIKPPTANNNQKKEVPLTAPGKENGVQKVFKESSTKKTPKPTVVKHQHHIVLVKPNDKPNNIKNNALGDTIGRLEKDVLVTAKDNEAQDVTCENSNTITRDLDLADSKNNNVMEIKEHKYEEIRVNPNIYYPPVDTRNLKAIPHFNSEFGCDLSQANPYDKMEYGYDENNIFYVCENNVDQRHGHCFLANFKREPYVGYEELNIIKKTWLDTEIKIKTNLNQVNQQSPCYYNNDVKNSYSGVNNDLPNKLYQNSYQYFS